ncbi:MAG: dephospho-CoA kinase [Bacteroidales bacterium]|nr:dephospho-CoA kinase [Bacteroidales bacterium]
MNVTPTLNPAQALNPAQVEVMNMMSFVNSQSSWNRMKEAIADYFAKQLDDEIDGLWADGTLTEEKVQSFETLHERTPYR